MESILNAEIFREGSLISARQQNLTTELNRANQILQVIPSMLNQVNEFYSASTGYHNNSNG
jgi:flagellar hook-associated protein 2